MPGWQGPFRHRGAMVDLYFAGGDVPDDADLTGSVVFHFACYGAGTPAQDDFGAAGARKEIAPAPFVSRLPQRLLGKPGGGALAVIGHVERAWSYSFASPEFGAQTNTFELCLRTLMSGLRIGFAMEAFAMRHAQLAVGLNRMLDDIRHDARIDDFQVAGLASVHHHARNGTRVSATWPSGSRRDGEPTCPWGRKPFGGTDIRYHLVLLDADGKERGDDPDGRMSERITQALHADRPTDVFVFIHGWKGDMYAAPQQYAAWMSTLMCQARDLERARANRPWDSHRRRLGVHWPSLPFGYVVVRPGRVLRSRPRRDRKRDR